VGDRAAGSADRLEVATRLLKNADPAGATYVFVKDTMTLVRVVGQFDLFDVQAEERGRRLSDGRR
jgi:hypothetical protein